MKRNLPKHRELWALVKRVRSSIDDDWRADEESEEPSTTLTVGWDPDTGRWSYQTGDNSYTGGAYGFSHWAVVYVARRTPLRETAREIRSQLNELCW